LQKGNRCGGPAVLDAKHEVNDKAYELLTRDGYAVEGEFLCECLDLHCIEFITLTTQQFVARRAAGQPILANGH
jgi:hypothetical protein